MLAGIARDQRRDTELALSWLARIPASSPTAVQAEGLKAQILADAGKEKEALASVRNLQQRHARNETLLLLEVRLLARLKAMDEALARARQAVEIVPESSELAFTLGSLLDSLGKRDEAMKVMQGIIASHPEHYQALNYVGYSLAVQGKDLEHALELLQRPTVWPLTSSSSWIPWPGPCSAWAVRKRPCRTSGARWLSSPRPKPRYWNITATSPPPRARKRKPARPTNRP